MMVMPVSPMARWDREKLAVAVHRGVGRREFVLEAEAKMAEARAELEGLAGRPKPDAMWQKISDVLSEVALEHFKLGRPEDYKQLQSRRDDLLRRRANWRQGFEDFATHCPSIAAAISTISKQLRTLRRRDVKERKRAQADLLYWAWKRREGHQAHVLSTLLAGTGVGLRRRFYNLLPAARPTIGEMVEFGKKDAAEGGLEGSEVDFEAELQQALLCGAARFPQYEGQVDAPGAFAYSSLQEACKDPELAPVINFARADGGEDMSHP